MSSFIKLKNISFSYNNLSTDLLSNVTFSCHKGWTSICGPNGCGKTTLFKLITGELQADLGTLESSKNICHLKQEVHETPASLNHLKDNYSVQALRLKNELQINDNWFDNYATLSHGERKRIQLAIALSQEPAILLVDEPANHLDEDSKIVIRDTLKKFRGVGLLISHDRTFLNKLCQTTVFIEPGIVHVFNAPYDIAKLEIQQMYKENLAQYNITKNNLLHTKIAANKQNDKIASKKKNLSKKGITKKDSDAKAKVNLARLTNAGVSDARKKHVLDNKSQRLGKVLSGIKVKKEYDLGIFFSDSKKPAQTLFWPQKTLQTDFISLNLPGLHLRAGSKIAITGKNGSGKTTLLNFLATTLAADKYIYAKQETTSLERTKLHINILKMNKEKLSQLFTLINCFGSDPKTIVDKTTPSPGVWQKIMIALAILENAPILLLDEPTNHMDLPAIEILENALKLFPGILVMVSHDRTFIESTCNQELHLTKSGKVSNSMLRDLENNLDL